MPRRILLTRVLLPAALLAAALMLSAIPAPAVVASPGPAGAYREVLQVYQRQGTVPACRFSSNQLAAALKGVDVYGQQYFADFTAAIQTALSQRAAGACSPGRGAAGTAAGRRSGAAAGPAIPTTVTAPTGAGTPAPILILGVLAAVGLLALVIASLRRARGLHLAAPGPWRHLWQEATWRSEGTWDAFRDWLRTR